MFYYLSLGSSLNPEQNAVQMVYALCHRFGCIALFPFRYTASEVADDDTVFLNALAVIRSTSGAQDVKARLNAIEEGLGRDRSESSRKIKKHTADIDILSSSLNLDFSSFEMAEEAYIGACFFYRGKQADLKRLGLIKCERVATVYLDAESDDLVLVDDELRGFIHGVDPAITKYPY